MRYLHGQQKLRLKYALNLSIFHKILALVRRFWGIGRSFLPLPSYRPDSDTAHPDWIVEQWDRMGAFLLLVGKRPCHRIHIVTAAERVQRQKPLLSGKLGIGSIAPH